MKIVFCLASLGSGGAERVVSLLANKMDVKGHQVEIVCLKYNDVYYQSNEGVRVTLAKEHTKGGLSEMVWLRKYMKSAHPDVVIAFTEGVYCYTIFALLGTGIPVIASERLDPSAMAWNRKLLKKLLLPFASWLVVQTQSIKRYFSQNIQKKTSIIFNPVNENVFGDEQRVMKENQIISVARLFPQKNQQMMIRAFAQIAEKFPDWKLVIYGDGPLRAELEALIASLRMQDRVLLPGRTEQVVDELRKSKIFCLSSDYEGMSNSMIEAICVGLPVISTKVSGTEELIQEGINGLLINLGDETGMAQAMENLIQNEKLRLRMGEENRKNSSLFQLDTIVDEWMTLIKNQTSYEQQKNAKSKYNNTIN